MARMCNRVLQQAILEKPRTLLESGSSNHAGDLDPNNNHTQVHASNTDKYITISGL